MIYIYIYVWCMYIYINIYIYIYLYIYIYIYILCIQCEQQTLKCNSNMRLHYLNKYYTTTFARLKFKGTPWKSKSADNICSIIKMGSYKINFYYKSDEKNLWSFGGCLDLTILSSIKLNAKTWYGIATVNILFW